MRRWIALGVLALAVAWGPYLYAELGRRPVAPSSKPRELPAVFDEPPQAALAAASGVPKLESQAAAATEPPAPATVLPARAGPPPEPEPTAVANQPATPEFVDPAGLPAELAPAFHGAFDAQPRDAFWAQTEEPRIKDMIHAIGVPDDIIAAVACRKTVCRTTLNSVELDKDVEVKLYAKLREEFGNSVALEVRDLEGGARAALYVLRPGYKLESPVPSVNPQREVR